MQTLFMYEKGWDSILITIGFLEGLRSKQRADLMLQHGSGWGKAGGWEINGCSCRRGSLITKQKRQGHRVCFLSPDMLRVCCFLWETCLERCRCDCHLFEAYLLTVSTTLQLLFSSGASWKQQLGHTRTWGICLSWKRLCSGIPGMHTSRWAVLYSFFSH